MLHTRKCAIYLSNSSRVGSNSRVRLVFGRGYKKVRMQRGNRFGPVGLPGLATNIRDAPAKLGDMRAGIKVFSLG